MGFTAGIIGLPNTGKSTVFNALSGSNAAMAGYPFTTIDPNRATVTVPDARLATIAGMLERTDPIPTHLEFFDVAGLVQGASRGEGLGNTFLGHIRSVEALIHVVRCFESQEAQHIMGTVDPLRDIEIVNTELLLADLELLERDRARTEKRAQTGDREAARRIQALSAMADHLGGSRLLKSFEMTDAACELVQEYGLITAKPVLYLANTGETAFDPAVMEALARRAAADDAALLSVSGKLEEEISELPPGDKREYLAAVGLEQSGLERLIEASYRLLELITFYTTTTALQAWTVRRDTSAPDAAGRIHSDFQRGFIRAEVYHFDDLLRAGSEQRLREAGLLRSEGRSYRVQDGDIIHFLFNP